MSKFKKMLPYLIIIAVVILLRIFIVTPVRVSGDSMEPTLHTGEIMVLNKIKSKTTDIKRFDIVVIKYNGEKLIKRVIGLPGEKIEYKDEILYVNGKAVMETYLTQPMSDYNITSLGSETVPDDSYFVLGDNRSNSLDSRLIGFIKKKDIEGITNFVLFPFSEFGSKR